jgi:2-polyprenyl-3-methyl-5-hydroxy-6-metoxy-1,4-benzoquinol methylase
MRLPSRLHIGTRDRLRLLASNVRPGDRFLELGCAPGKILAYVRAVLHADVSGIDYSPQGIAWARRLFNALGIEGDLRCEDLSSISLPPSSFDVVHSAGLIEHFSNPESIVALHMHLLRPGGKALITIPNLNGFYLPLANHFSPHLVQAHNLSIMNTQALLNLVPARSTSEATATPFGHIGPDLIQFGRRWPYSVAACSAAALNLLGLLQPFTVPALAPYLLLRIVKNT